MSDIIVIKSAKLTSLIKFLIRVLIPCKGTSRREAVATTRDTRHITMSCEDAFFSFCTMIVIL